MPKIDTKDRKILANLDMNARMPITELAKKVGLSRQVVEYRIKRLQKNNVIFGALAIFDSVVTGHNWYRIAFRLMNATKQQKNELIDFLKNHKHMLWLGEIGGNWDLAMNFICKDNFEFNRVFEEIIKEYGNLIMDYEILIYVNVYDLQRKYILQDEKPRNEFFHEMKFNPKIKLDKLDNEIIRELSKNALISNIELGQKLNVTGNTIKNRLNQMKKNKLLLGFRLFINPSVYGYKSHMLFLEITRLDLNKEKELVNYLRSIPNTTFLVKHIGRWRYGMEIETQNIEEFQEIFVDIRGKFSNIITNFEAFPLFKDHAIDYYPEGVLD